MSTETTVQILCITFFIIAGLFTIPMCILCGYKLKENWNQQFIIKRRKWLILSQYLLFAWHSFIEFPYFVGSLLSNIPLTIYSFFGMVYVISVLIRSVTGSMYLLRVYILYYDHQYTKILSQQKWQILIDPNIENSNWFLINKKHRFGNPLYIIKYIMTPILLIFFSIFCIIQFTFSANHDSLQSDLIGILFTGFYCIMLVIAGIYFWTKFPQILDTLLIRKEISFALKILSMFPLALIIGIILQFINIIDPIISLCIMLIVLELAITFVFFILVPYASIKQSNGYMSTELMMASTLESQTSNKDISWQDVIKTNDGFEQFTCFLEREFAVENILYLCEYIQLKQVMIQKEALRNIIENDLELTYSLILPETIPKSIIAKRLSEFIHNESIKQAYIEACAQLFIKYIDPSTASLEVNIDSQLRYKLFTAFQILSEENDYSDTKCIGMIMPLLEQCCNQISMLINDSSNRFKRTSVFVELTKINSDKN